MSDGGQNSQADALAQIMATRARTFGFAARFLPRERRHAATVLYAFCRVVDDLADDVAPEIGLPALHAWETWIEWLDHRAAGRAFIALEPLLPAGSDAVAGDLAQVISDYGVPHRYLGDLVRGAIADATRTQVADFAELRRFCYSVAGTVGRAMAHVLGAPGVEAGQRAEQLGIAMQLTNILRDVGEDLERGRVYLPADELARFGVTAADLAHGRTGEPFTRLMQFQVRRARAFYASGLPGVFLLPADSRFAILLAGRLYAAILSCIERQQYRVFDQRASTSTAYKIGTAAATYASLRFGGWLAPASTVEVAFSTGEGRLAGPEGVLNW